MKCKNETCSNEATGSSAYCGDSCRAVYNRNKRNTGTGTIATGTVPEQVTGTHRKYLMVSGVTCYGRPAVQCSQYRTRPDPLDPHDQPHSGGRGRYTRQDGSVYQFDSSGNSFEVTGGKVYQSAEEVKACYA